MKHCPYCGQEYPDSATACAIDRQPLSSGTSSGAPGAEVELDATLSPPDVVPEPFVPPHRSWLGRLLGNRLTWFSILGLAWALVLLKVVSWPSTSYYQKPPVESGLFAVFFPLTGPMGLMPDGLQLELIGSLVVALLFIAGFWGSFFWFMSRLKVLKQSTLLVISAAYLIFIALNLMAWAAKNASPGYFDL